MIRSTFVAAAQALIVAALLGCGCRLEAAQTAWQIQAARIRLLAENDPPLARMQALDLQADLPANAPPADQAQVLNLLARSETYLARTAEATEHARQALALATRHGDRIGQIEAQLNMALNSINAADIDGMVAATTQALALLDGIDRPRLVGEAMLRGAMLYRRQGKIEESLVMCLQAMEVARRSNDPLALTYAHQGLSISYGQSGHQQQALQHFQQMREYAQRVPSRLLEAHALVGLGDTAIHLGDTDSARARYKEAITLFQAAGSPGSLSFGLFGLAELHRQQHEHEQALALLGKVVDIYERHPNKIGLWYTLNARSANHLALGNSAAALADAERARALAQAIGFAPYLAESARRVATIAAGRGDHRQAYALSVEAEELSAQAARAKVNAQVIELGQRFESEGKRRQIDELTHRNEQQSTELRRRDLERRWLGSVLLGSLLALAGAAYFLRRVRRSQNALERQTEILQSVLDSMADGVLVADQRGHLVLVNPAAERIGALACMVAGGEASAPQVYLEDQHTPYPSAALPLARAIRGESCDSVQLFIREPDQDQGRWLSASSRPLINKSGHIRGGVAVLSDITVHKRAEQEIRSIEQLRRELEFRREAAREEERKHIARELHDELGQHLSALRMELSVLRMRWGVTDLEVRDKARSLQASVDQVIAVVRNLVTSLRPAVLDMGIAAALEWLAAEFSASSRVRCTLTVDEAAVSLDSHQTNLVFRLVQESLTNIARHADAREVHVTLQKRNDSHVLLVQDDGQGFNPRERAPQSFGLMGMRERAEMLGGRLDIRSHRGTGTSIAVKFPVTQPATAQSGSPG